MMVSILRLDYNEKLVIYTEIKGEGKSVRWVETDVPPLARTGLETLWGWWTFPWTLGSTDWVARMWVFVCFFWRRSSCWWRWCQSSSILVQRRVVDICSWVLLLFARWYSWDLRVCRRVQWVLFGRNWVQRWFWRCSICTLLLSWCLFVLIVFQRGSPSCWKTFCFCRRTPASLETPGLFKGFTIRTILKWTD